MLFRLIASVVLAVGVAGIVILFNRYVFKGRLPKWVMPSSIALAVLGFQIYEEYHWFPRSRDGLDKDYVIVQEFQNSNFWRPWSYIWPSVTSFTAVNKVQAQPLHDHDDLWVSSMTSVSYLGTSSGALFVFDCSNARFGPYQASVEEVQWGQMDQDFYLLVCEDV